MLPAVVGWLLQVGAALTDIYYSLAIYSARRFFRQPIQPAADFTPPVSILKPVCGLDREAYENFASFCRQDYPEYEILFAVSEEHDPAVAIVQKLMRDFPERSLHLIVGSGPTGSNRKVSKLCRLVREAHYDLLVISDSDIRVGPEYLRAVAAPFRDSKVGLVTCPYGGLAGPGLGSELEALGMSSDLFAGVLADWQLEREKVRFAFGSTIVTTRERLAEIGGFESIADQLADDCQLGCRIAARGYRVVLVPYAVWTAIPLQTIGEFLRHQLRWAVTIRECRPWGHLGLLLTHGLPWSLAAALHRPSAGVSLGFLATYLVLRLTMAWTVGVWGLKDSLLRRKLWLVPVRDALWFLIWLVSLFWDRIEWRGQEFFVRKGRLIPISARASRS